MLGASPAAELHPQPAAFRNHSNCLVPITCCAIFIMHHVMDPILQVRRLWLKEGKPHTPGCSFSLVFIVHLSTEYKPWAQSE